MIKNSSIRRICVATLALIILLIIYFFPSNKPLIEESLNYTSKNEMPIFLMDKMEYVARTSIVKNSNDLNQQIEEIVESLTVGSKKSSYIKNGFKPLIPENTKILNMEIKNQILTINFSKEFLNCEKEYEEKMLEALIYSLLELKEITKIEVLVENTNLKKLPKSNIKLPKYLDKSYGINKLYNFDSLKQTTKTTIYYISKNEQNNYYVPITKVSNENIEKVEIIIKELQKTPIYHTNLISYLASSTNISDYELLEKSISISFDNYLLANIKDNNLLEEVKYSIFLSLRDTYGVNEVIFNIPNLEKSSIAV